MPSTVTTNNKINTAIAGCIEEYLNKAWQTLKLRNFMTPLANSELGSKGVIPKNQGQIMVFRIWDDFGLGVDVAQDEDLVTADLEALTSTQGKVPLAEFAGGFDLGKFLADTDPVDLMRQAKDRLQVSIRRTVHRKVNAALAATQTVTSAYGVSGQDFSMLPLPYIYAGGKSSAANLTDESYIAMDDFIEAKSRLENDGKEPAYEDGSYAAIIDPAVENTLVQQDSEFRDVAKRHRDMVKTVYGMGRIIPYAGMRFIVQNDAYRCVAGNDPATLANRSDTGKIHVCHVLGKDAFTYLDLGSARNRLTPPFKVQDISVTGNRMTVAYRIPFRAACIRKYGAGTDSSARGVNIAGAALFDRGLAG